MEKKVTLEEYYKLVKILSKKEVETVQYLLFYYAEFENIFEVPFSLIKEKLYAKLLGNINYSRLKQNIIKSQLFVKGKLKDTFCLSKKTYTNMKADLINVFTFDDDEIVENKSIIPESYFKIKLRYIIKLFEQINFCYENNCFDAAALMMRRLSEVLLILVFENNNKANLILSSDKEYRYKNFNEIILIAKQNAINLRLDNDVLSTLNKAKDLGNFAAHKITYNTHVQAIDVVIKDFQIMIQQLLNLINVYN